MAITLGVDIGQTCDPTAICVAETVPRRDCDRLDLHFLIRHLERLPLRTPYPTKVAQRIAQVAGRVAGHSGKPPRIFIDATGVGAPIVDLLREAGGRCITAVHFTRGTGVTKKPDQRITLGKEDMVSRLQALFQMQRIHLPQNQEAQALARELLNFEIRINTNARARFGAFRTGTHDDLVTALGLATQITARSKAACQSS